MDMPLLKKLDLRGNKIEKIELVPDLPQLESLNLDENQITDCKQIASLEPMSSVTILSLKGNPCAEEKGDDFKKEVLMQLIEMKQLKTVNEEEVT
jgi:Leucine-rich repeat (LRR) protein